MDIDSAAKTHERIYDDKPQVVAAAPGRVNIIGEHVDYSDGMVLPFAISQAIVVSASMDNSGLVTVHSAGLDKRTSFPVDVNSPSNPPAWENYIRGMVHGLCKKGVHLLGAKLLIDGNLQSGYGMSSSAALCVSAGMALTKLAHVEIPREQIAKIAQTSEHDFVGMPCGIMDQMAVCFAKKDHATLIDCKDLTHEYVPCRTNNVSFLVIPSGVNHSLTDGAYEKRVASCRKAVSVISQTNSEIRTLRDVDADTLTAHRDKLDRTTFNRAQHVISEMARVNSAVEALRAGNWHRVGALLWQTQDSLRDEYEVSCEEIDQLIDILRKESSVLGARMVGGGFGGIVLAVVQTEHIAKIQELVATAFYAALGISQHCFTVKPSEGANAVFYE